MKRIERILVTRTDRLGDVLLSLPSLTYLRLVLPKKQILFVCKEDYLCVVKPTLESQNIECLESSKLKEVLSGSNLVSAALCLFPDSRLMLNLLRYGVQLRVGAYSKPLSLLCFNRGLWQRRSTARKNEAEYNLDLAKNLVEYIEPKTHMKQIPPIELTCDTSKRLLACSALESIGIDPFRDFTVIHPGMGKSATNLSSNGYERLIDRMHSLFARIVVSLGPNEMTDPSILSLIDRIKTIHVLPQQPLAVLMEVFRLAKLVLAPSTGPLHLAHYVGTNTVGLYSPVRAHSPVRWNPWGGTGKHKTIMPEVSCPARRHCFEEKCTYYSCMDGLPKSTNLAKIMFNQYSGGSTVWT